MLSRYDDAQRHFEQALRMNGQIRSPLWIAHAQHDYAYMLIQRNYPGDGGKALALVNQALATAEQLGLRALADKAKALKIVAETAAPPSPLPKSP